VHSPLSKEELEIQTGSRIGSLVSSIVQFAMGSAEQLIVDKDGNVLWPQPFEFLSRAIVDGHDPTLYEIADAIEPFVLQKTVDDLHSVVTKLPLTVRAEIAGAVTFARSALWMKKAWRDELVTKKQNYILFTVRTAKTVATYNLLATHPNIATLITAYIFRVLNLDYEPVLQNKIGVQPQIQVVTTEPPNQ
jgi:hypothetical protein